MIPLVLPFCFHFYNLLFTHVILYRSPFKPATLNWNFCINNVYKIKINKINNEVIGYNKLIEVCHICSICLKLNFC